MTREELTQLESDLAAHGYRKFTQALSSREDWGWFKTICPEGAEIHNSNTRLYTIEFRIWEYLKYYNGNNEYIKQNPYSVDTLILDGDSSYRIDLEITSPKFNIETTEKIAADLHKMLAPYVEKYKDNEP